MLGYATALAAIDREQFAFLDFEATVLVHLPLVKAVAAHRLTLGLVGELGLYKRDNFSHDGDYRFRVAMKARMFSISLVDSVNCCMGKWGCSNDTRSLSGEYLAASFAIA